MIRAAGVVDASPGVVWQVLVDSAAYDAGQAMKVSPAPRLTEGFSYVKPVMANFGRQRGETRVTVGRLIPGELYEAVFDNSQGQTRIAYHLEADGETTRVIYEEETLADGPLQRLNSRLLAGWMRKKTNCRITLLLRQIDAYLQENKIE